MTAFRFVQPEHWRWPVSLEELPTLLELLDDQGLALEVGVTEGTKTLSFQTSGLRCRHADRRIEVEGPERSLCIDLDRLTDAWVVNRRVGPSRRLSLELSSRDQAQGLSLTGPDVDTGQGGEIWSVLLRALTPVAHGAEPHAPSQATGPVF